jgi:hypothetical protein
MLNHWVFISIVSLGTAVDIATGLDDVEVGVLVPAGSRIFHSTQCPTQLCSQPRLPSNRQRGFLPGGKTTATEIWRRHPLPHTSLWRSAQLHTETTFFYLYYWQKFILSCIVFQFRKKYADQESIPLPILVSTVNMKTVGSYPQI